MLDVRLIYLDFDGVLHPEGVRLPNPNRPKQLVPPQKVAGWTRGLLGWSALLNEALTPYPDVRIVLSTAWVQALSFHGARSYLPGSLKKRTIGATFHSRMNQLEFMRLSRGEQVEQDLERRGARAWVAIDDNQVGWSVAAQGHLVHPDPAHGLGRSDTYLQLKAVLAKQFGVPHGMLS